MTLDVVPQAYSAVWLCVLQNAVVLDPYAKAIIGRRQFGDLGPVSCRHSTTPSCDIPERLLLADIMQERPQYRCFAIIASGHRPWCRGSSRGVAHLAAVRSCVASGRRLRLAGRSAPAPASGQGLYLCCSKSVPKYGLYESTRCE